MGKISNYARVLVSKLTDVFVVDQTDNGTTETKSATVEQIGTAIGTLQNFADLDTSNKNLVDAINEIASYTPVYGNTASGAIATFDTSLALPLQDCTIEINAVQESGTPTPSSPKAISGFTGANIHVADDETPHVIDNVTAITWQDEAGTVYGGSLDVTSGVLTVTWGSVDLSTLNWTSVARTGFDLWTSTGLSSLAKLPASNADPFNALCNIYGVMSYNAVNGSDNPNSISLRINGTMYLNNGSNVNEPEGFLAYELATPVTYQLTPTQISAIVGTNNVFTDTNGDTSVVYACSLKDYIEGQ